MKTDRYSPFVHLVDGFWLLAQAVGDQWRFPVKKRDRFDTQVWWTGSWAAAVRDGYRYSWRHSAAQRARHFFKEELNA